MSQPPTILACDVGGTRIKLGLVRDDKLLVQEEIAAFANEGLACAFGRIVKTAKRLCRTTNVPLKNLSGLGLAFPGIIEPGTERILSTPAGKFDDAKNLDFPRMARQLLDVPTLVCNDANAALHGESILGAGCGCRSVVMLSLGTGIGTSAIIDGAPVRGRHGQAGSLGGHFTIKVDGKACPCGNIGCAESEASTWALPSHAEAHPEWTTSRLARRGQLDYAAVFAEAASGDKVALSLREHSLRVWSAVLVNLIHAYDPECAVIGGGIMASGRTILPRLRQHAARHAWTPSGRVKIKAAMLGNNAGMLGVARLMADKL